MEQQFFKCAVCGQIVAMVKQTKVPVMCCGAPMQKIVAGTTEASIEKHIPKYTVIDGIVKVDVGSVEHPMTEDHYIEWVSLQTKKGNQRKSLKPSTKPYVEFLIEKEDQVEAVYAYCNLHGLWKA